MFRARHPDAPGPRGSFPQTTQYVRRPIQQQLRDSIPAVIIGILLILCGSALLFWNEGRAVQTSRSLDEGYNAVIRVQSSSNVLEENNHKLVHVTGSLSSSPVLSDDYYGVEIAAVRLKRRVQMYQWVEEESGSRSDETDPMAGDTSSYSYIMDWRDKTVDSSSFNIPWGHENPTSIPVASLIQTAETAQVGVYQLSPAIKERFTDYSAFSGDDQPESDEIKLHAGVYYLTRDIYSPEVGDLRVQFYFAGHIGESISVIGQQIGETLHPYMTSTGNQLMLLQSGSRSVEEMFSSEHAQNRVLTWSLRLAGWFLMFLGLTCVSHIVNSLVSSSRLLREVVTLGLGSTNCTLSMSTSLVIIGGAWCVYRPGLALLILVVAALPFIRAAINHNATGETLTQRTNGYRRIQ